MYLICPSSLEDTSFLENLYWQKVFARREGARGGVNPDAVVVWDASDGYVCGYRGTSLIIKNYCTVGLCLGPYGRPREGDFQRLSFFGQIKKNGFPGCCLT